MTSVVKIAILGAALAGLLACGRPAAPPAAAPLLYEDAQVARARKIAVFVPGAFSSVDIFAAAADWSRRGYAPVYYRLPGMDGMPLRPDLSIDAAAGEIAAFAARYPGKPLALVGFSTGGPIALLAAERVRDGRPVSVAAISSAVEHGGGLPTLLRGARDIASAALETGSLRRGRFWRRYWQSLLFGPRALKNPGFDAAVGRLTRRYGQDITVPDAPMLRAHTRDLSRWTLERPPALDHAKVGFFIGLRDPVFSTRQTIAFRNRIGTGRIFGYRDDGHLLVLTQEDLFETVFRFIDGPADISGDPP